MAIIATESPGERRSVVACLRTCGGAALEIEPLAPPRLARLWWGGVLRDEVLVVDRGALGLELHLHGSPQLVLAIEQQFGALRQTADGPADALLRAALSPEQLALALEQRGMDFAAFLHRVRGLPPPERLRELAAAQRRSLAAQAMVRAQPLVLIGRQNAGKSTLFNRLLFRERALTGATAGLTRDPVRETTSLSGYPYELVDTAGEGDPGVEGLDAAAVARARRERRGALCLLIVDASRGPAAIDRALLAPDVLPDVLVVANKVDLPAAPWPEGVPRALSVQAADPAAAPGIRTAAGELLRSHRGLPPAGAVGGPAALDRDQQALLDSLVDELPNAAAGASDAGPA